MRTWFFAAVVVATMGGCSSGDGETQPAPTSVATLSSTTELPAVTAPQPSATITAPTTTSEAPASATDPDESPYDEYARIVEGMGGLLIGREDAAIRASLLCSGAADDMLGGVPITEFPTDHALVIAYCPDYLNQ